MCLCFWTFPQLPGLGTGTEGADFLKFHVVGHIYTVAKFKPLNWYLHVPTFLDFPAGAEFLKFHAVGHIVDHIQ